MSARYTTTHDRFARLTEIPWGIANILLLVATDTHSATIRRATDGDVPAILALNAAGNGDIVADEIEAALSCGFMSAGDFAVAIAGDEVVSTVGLLAMQLWIGDVVVPCGQPEFVVTRETSRHQGLVRALIDLVHGWSGARGDLVQIIAGIPYFYRQFGYAYGLRRPPEWLVAPETRLSGDEGWEIRPAVLSDEAALCGLQDKAQAGADVRLPFSEGLWPVLLTLPHAPVWVASRDGRAEAAGRLRISSDAAFYLQAIAASSTKAAKALITGVRAMHPGRSLVVAERAALPLAGLLGPALPVPRRKWLHVRIDDPAALLQKMVPVLSGRLARSAFASESGHIEISLYRSSIGIDYDQGRITRIRSTSGEHPGYEPDVSLPPDLLPTLLFGTGAVIDLAAEPDVDLGKHRDVMGVLLPPLRTDVLIW